MESGFAEGAGTPVFPEDFCGSDSSQSYNNTTKGHIKQEKVRDTWSILAHFSHFGKLTTFMEYYTLLGSTHGHSNADRQAPLVTVVAVLHFSLEPVDEYRFSEMDAHAPLHESGERREGGRGKAEGGRRKGARTSLTPGPSPRGRGKQAALTPGPSPEGEGRAKTSAPASATQLPPRQRGWEQKKFGHDKLSLRSISRVLCCVGTASQPILDGYLRFGEK